MKLEKIEHERRQYDEIEEQEREREETGAL